MKTYKIFSSPIRGNEAVKIGWTWPGFLFCWIWMLVKGMWATFAFTALGIIVLVSIVPEPASRALAIVVCLIVGIFGNEWRTKELSRKGYVEKTSIQARTPEEALSIYVTNMKDN